jgi:DNA polymerase-1
MDTYQYKTYVRNVSENINATRIKTLDQISAEMDLSWVKNKNYEIVNTLSRLDQCIDKMMTKDYIAVDTETTGLNFHDIAHNNPILDRLVGICMSWEDNQGIYIPLRHVKFDNIDEVTALTKLKYILENKNIITHNGIFDGKVFYSLGIKLNIKHDTMYMQFNIDSDVKHLSKKLKHMIEHIWHYSPIEFEDIFTYEKDYRLFRYVDKDVARIYACADADHTRMLFKYLLPRLNDIHMKGYKKDIECLVPNMIRSEYCGKSINMSLLKKLNEINDKDLEMVEDLIYQYVGQEVCYKQTGHFKSERYKFNISSIPSLSDVVYNLLEYPRPKSNKSLDKKTLRFLLEESTASPSPVAKSLMPTDLLSNSVDYPELGYKEKDHILLKKNIFYSKKHRLVLLVELYRTLSKNKSSFFKPLIENSFEGKCFTSLNISRAATFRIIDNFQTLDKRLKKVVAPPDGYYMLGYDYAQIEARLMVGLAGDKVMTAQLDDPEADFHRLSASAIEGVRPEEITSEQRTRYKPVNFGIPYGIGPKKITEDKYGIGLTAEEFSEKLKETKEIIANWKVGMKSVWDMLERYRANALKPLPKSEVPWHLEGKPVGRVTSPFGRSRYVLLDNLTDAKKSSIGRKCGNFPIQCYARDIFVEGFSKLSRVLIKEGLMDIKVSDDYSPLGYHFENKVKFMAYIHDEVQMIVTQDINPKWMMKKIYENCVIRIPGHPTYYVGASIINNWYESKKGDHEVPIVWLQELPDDTSKFTPWNPNIQHDVDVECEEYVTNRIINEFKGIGVDITTSNLIISRDKLLEFKSYYLIGKACEMYPIDWSKVDEKANYNSAFINALMGKFNNTITITGYEENNKNSYNIANDSDADYEESFEKVLNNIIEDDSSEETSEFMDYIEEDTVSERINSEKNINSIAENNFNFLNNFLMNIK